MSVALVQSKSVHAASGQTISITMTTAPTNGNLLLASWDCTAHATGTTYTYGANWTPLLDTPSSGLTSAWKIAGSGESTTQTPITNGAQSTILKGFSAAIWEISGAATTAPIAHTTTANAVSITGTVTPTAAHSLILSHARLVGATTAPSGWTRDQFQSSGSDLWAHDNTLPSNTSTVSATWTGGSSSNNTAAVTMFAVAPPGAVIIRRRLCVEELFH